MDCSRRDAPFPLRGTSPGGERAGWVGRAHPRAPGRPPSHPRRIPERRPQLWPAVQGSSRFPRSITRHYAPGYPIVTPQEHLAVDLVLDPEVAPRKVRALAAQATQTGGLIAVLGLDTYTAWVGDEAFVESARRRAPALDVLSAC